MTTSGGGSREDVDPRARELAGRLFADHRRCGWQYVEPPARAGREELGEEPVRVARRPHDRARGTRRPVPVPPAMELKLFGMVALLTLAGWLTRTHAPLAGVVAVAAVALGGWWFGPYLVAGGLRLLLRALGRGTVLTFGMLRRAAADQLFARRHRNWQRRVAAFEADDAEDRSAAACWFPVELPARRGLIQVFGGNPEGWSSWLATTVPTVLRDGKSVVVVDFSQHDVTNELTQIVRARGLAVQRQSLPAELHRADLLRGLDRGQVAGVLSAAVNASHTGEERSERRLAFRQQAQRIVDRMDPPYTFDRLLAGVMAVQGQHEPGDIRLGPHELRELTRIARSNTTERARDDLQRLRDSLELLATSSGAVPAPEGDSLITEGGLRVLRTSEPDTLRRDLVSRLVAQALVERLPDWPEGRAGLVLVAADRLGFAMLEDLTDRARRSGTELVLMMQRIHDGLEKLLGADGVTVVMRLAGAAEAEAASRHIGRTWSFKFTQRSVQRGLSESVGTSESWGGSTSDGRTDGSGKGRSYRTWWDWPNFSKDTSSSRSVTVGESWQQAVDEQSTRSETDRETSSRVREFIVEPLVIQTLDDTEFLLVDARDGNRVVVSASADPVLALESRAAGRPVRPPAVSVVDELTAGPEREPAGGPSSRPAIESGRDGRGRRGWWPFGRTRPAAGRAEERREKPRRPEPGATPEDWWLR